MAIESQSGLRRDLWTMAVIASKSSSLIQGATLRIEPGVDVELLRTVLQSLKAS